MLERFTRLSAAGLPYGAASSATTTQSPLTTSITCQHQRQKKWIRRKRRSAESQPHVVCAIALTYHSRIRRLFLTRARPRPKTLTRTNSTPCATQPKHQYSLPQTLTLPEKFTSRMAVEFVCGGTYVVQIFNRSFFACSSAAFSFRFASSSIMFALHSTTFANPCHTLKSHYYKLLIQLGFPNGTTIGPITKLR
jgi:hypothetical protein